MRYVTGIERRAIAKGREEARIEGLIAGLLESISFGLELKFGANGLDLMSEISNIESLEMLRNIQDGLRKHEKLENIQALYQSTE